MVTLFKVIGFPLRLVAAIVLLTVATLVGFIRKLFDPKESFYEINFKETWNWVIKGTTY